MKPDAPLRAMDAYEHVQAMRAEAGQIAKRGTTDDLKSAASHLEGALEYQPLVFGLPGGGRARICVKRDVYADGREFVGKGIRPTIEVAETVEDFRSSRDAVFERAVKELSSR